MKKIIVMLICLIFVTGCQRNISTLNQPDEQINSINTNKEEQNNFTSEEDVKSVNNESSLNLFKSEYISIEEVNLTAYDNMKVSAAFWLDKDIILCYTGKEGLEKSKFVVYNSVNHKSTVIYEGDYIESQNLVLEADEENFSLCDGKNLLIFSKKNYELTTEVKNEGFELRWLTIDQAYSISRSDLGKIQVTNNFNGRSFPLDLPYTFTSGFKIRNDFKEVVFLGDYRDIVLLGLNEEKIGVTDMVSQIEVIWPDNFVDYLDVYYCDNANEIALYGMCENGGVYQFYNTKSNELYSELPSNDGYVSGIYGNYFFYFLNNQEFIAFNYKNKQTVQLLNTTKFSSVGKQNEVGDKLFFDLILDDESDNSYEQKFYIGTLNQNILDKLAFDTTVDKSATGTTFEYERYIMPIDTETVDNLTTDNLQLKEWQVDALMDKGYIHDEINKMTMEEIHTILTAGMTEEQKKHYYDEYSIID